MGLAFSVRVPATSANIGPGFDCLGVALGLYLTAECTPSSAFAMELHGEGADRLPVDGRNLLARCLAAGRMSDAPGAEPPLPPIRLVIRNEIPLAHGLGSSSAAIVAGLTVGRILEKIENGQDPALDGEDRERLVRAANRIEGHPDNVAPAVLGDLVICGAEEDSVVTFREPWPDALRFVAVIPDLTVSTEAARRALPTTIAHGDAVANGARLARLLGALRARRFEHLRSALQDRLHQPFRLPLATGLADVLAALDAHPDAAGAYLSGSGPTVMALCAESSERAEALGATGVIEFGRHGVSATSRILQVDRNGVSVGSG
ncbi:MAG: homoserine kinase [Candidatus Eisenbacteria bacterium]|uniref:Homoserine kinase n=1 Tax=Eiseniibacteriota bacterium TaxID=2212470 RepID=A0A956LZK4_UNCEI|nr:homoserine kinase [Candidatus Eisenbacteria bacterium]